jgi:hypothetical protein
LKNSKNILTAYKPKQKYLSFGGKSLSYVLSFFDEALMALINVKHVRVIP